MLKVTYFGRMNSTYQSHFKATGFSKQAEADGETMSCNITPIIIKMLKFHKAF